MPRAHHIGRCAVICTTSRGFFGIGGRTKDRLRDRIILAEPCRDTRHTWQYDESRQGRKKIELLFTVLRHLAKMVPR